MGIMLRGSYSIDVAVAVVVSWVAAQEVAIHEM